MASPPFRCVTFALALALSACGRVELDPGPTGNGGQGGGYRTTVVYPNETNRNLDVLFVVDKTAGIAPDQHNLVVNFPFFLAELDAQPGGWPNLHVGVVSSDLGAGTGLGGCVGNGDQGLLQAKPRGSC